MKRLPFQEVKVLAVSLFLLLIPSLVHAQTQQGQSGLPPIAAPLVREGDLALKLLPALGMGSTSNEILAKSKLEEAGIAPRNGWITDYPVTPDIVGELQKSVSDAGDAGRLTISKDEALKRLNDIIANINLSVTSHAADTPYGDMPSGSDNYSVYPDAQALNNYYVAEGPPVYTYYAPPPEYNNLYVFVPYPFWYSANWFPGFYILNDFNRTIFVNGRSFLYSNRFRDFQNHRYVRIDPMGRFQGRPFAARGVPFVRGFSNAGIQRRSAAILTTSNVRSGSGIMSPSYNSRMAGQAYHGNNMMNLSSRMGISGPTYRSAGTMISSYHNRGMGASYRSGGSFSGRAGGFSGRSGGGSSGRSGGGSSGRGGGRRK